jgi:hypothetical protein
MKWRSLRPLVVVIVVAAAVPTVVSATGVADKRDRTYEKRPLHATRALDLQYEADYQYEAAFEKCEIQSLDHMASMLQVPPQPGPVARAYAKRHQPAYREAVGDGCRDAYLGRWNPPE